jgi:CarD family transcriptional regulator
MRLTVGSKVFYPYQGLCLISMVVKRVIDGTQKEFYHLTLLDNSGSDLFVPIDKVEAIGIRPLLKESDIPKLLDRLKQPTQSSSDSRQRTQDNQRLLASGSAFDLAAIVQSLTALSQTKALSPGEHRTIDRARRLLISEISEVMRETKEEAEEQVDEALETLKEEVNLSPMTGKNGDHPYYRNSDRKKISGQKKGETQRAGAQCP